MSAHGDSGTKPIKWYRIVGNEHTVLRWDFDEDIAKTEEYLNQMIARGWQPIRVSWGFSFTFVPCTPGECICRTVMTVRASGFFDHRKAAGITELLLTSGAYIVEQRSTLGTQIGLIAVRAVALGPFDLVTDLDSRIAEHQARKGYYEGMGALYASLGLVWFILASTSPNSSSFGFVASVLFFIVGICYSLPAWRYAKIVKRLKSERAISET
jgi:hypothetical protein